MWGHFGAACWAFVVLIAAWNTSPEVSQQLLRFLSALSLGISLVQFGISIGDGLD